MSGVVSCVGFSELHFVRERSARINTESLGHTGMHATIDKGYRLDVELGQFFKTRLILQGWMQSMGRAATCNSSLVQVAVITYAIPLKEAIAAPVANYRF